MKVKNQVRRLFQHRTSLGGLGRTVNKRLIDINELSEYIGLSTSTIYSWVSQRRIPFVKCGRLTKFDLQRINDWIEESSVKEKKFY